MIVDDWTRHVQNMLGDKLPKEKPKRPTILGFKLIFKSYMDTFKEYQYLKANHYLELELENQKYDCFQGGEEGQSREQCMSDASTVFAGRKTEQRRKLEFFKFKVLDKCYEQIMGRDKRKSWNRLRPKEAKLKLTKCINH